METKTHISKELDLLLTCCKDAPFEFPKPGSFDQDLFFKLVKAHRVIPQVHLAFAAHRNQFPSLFQKLEKLNERATKKMLILSSNLLRIQSAFSNKNIDVLAFKGPALAQLVYGSLNARFSRDLDLLVRQKDLNKATTELKNLGFEKCYPDFDLSPKQQAYFERQYDQMVFVKRKPYVVVELHWRLFQNKHLLPISAEELITDKQTLDIGRSDIHTLSNKHLLLYLAAHGAKHNWEKIYWLADFSNLYKKDPSLFRSSLEEAKKLQVEQILYQAIMLSGKYLGTSVEKWILEAAKNNNKAVKLTHIASQALEEHTNNHRSRSYSTLLDSLFYRIKLKPTWKYRLAYFKPVSVYDFNTVQLPDSLFFLYFPLRPAIWCWRIFFHK
ncbi:nucleotidyltransferase family protein [Bacteroidota bacterium]